MSNRDEGSFTRLDPVELPGDSAPTVETEPVDEAPPAPAPKPGVWQSFQRWRRSRPFWGALFAFIGGAEILVTYLAPLGLVIHFGPVGLLGYAVPILIMLCALFLWFAPNPRPFYASLVLLLSLGSWITSNLGGFIIGMLFGIVGGALALTWTDAPRRRKQAPTT